MTHKQWENGERLNICNATKEQLKLMVKNRDETIKRLRIQLDEFDEFLDNYTCDDTVDFYKYAKEHDAIIEIKNI